MNTNTEENIRPCGMLRRLGAMLYDFLLLMAMWMIATAVLMPFTGGEAVSGNALYRSYLFLLTFVFFAWFWGRGGQTLGMRAWHIYLVNDREGPISMTQMMLRFIVAIASWGVAGLGFIWALFQKDKRSWHDLYSETYLVYKPK